VPLDDAGSRPVRPVTGSNWQVANNDFDRALDAALAPLDQLIPGPRRRAEAPRMAQNQETYRPWLVSRKATRCTAD
jgi:hypothetical protein